MSPSFIVFALACTAVVSFVVVQILWSFKATSLLRRAYRLPDIPDADLPKVGVVIGLRGADPSLEEGLDALLQQDYPNYKVFVIVDSKTDPAWPIVTPLVQKHGVDRMEVADLRNPPDTCSLKIAAFLQGVAQTDDSYDVVVSVDSDVDLERDWLRRLVRPFQDPEVKVTGGVRWFHATAGGLGTLIRFCWNSFCVAWMLARGTPWGGCMAIRRDYAFETQLIDRWRLTMSEDMTVATHLKERGDGKFAVAPVVGNCRETISVPSFLTYGRRQLMYARTHHYNWPLVYALNVLPMFGYAIVLAMGLLYAMANQWTNAYIALGVVTFYWTGLAIAQMHMDRRFGARHKLSWSLLWQWPMAGILTHWMQFEFTLFASWRRRVLWRGIEYNVETRSVKRLNYTPFVAPATAGRESVI